MRNRSSPTPATASSPTRKSSTSPRCTATIPRRKRSSWYRERAECLPVGASLKEPTAGPGPKISGLTCSAEGEQSPKGASCSTRQRYAHLVLEQALAARLGEPPRREAERVRAAPEKLLQGIVVEFGRREAAQVAAFERGDCETVAEEHAIVRDRRHARFRGHDSDEIERIGAGERDGLAASLQLPHGAQAPDRIGERKLLAAEGRDEA